MRRLSLLGCFGVLVLIFSAFGTTYAASSKSANYEVNEVQFSGGSVLNSQSGDYKAQESIGYGGGLMSSSNYKAYSGFLTPNVPFLSLAVGTSNLNLGVLNSSTASTGVASFEVEAYVDSGYVVMSMNNPPTQEDGKTLKALSTATASSPGSEQFGINLVRNDPATCSNSSPATFGENPVQEPNDNYATGAAASGYNTCGLFKYNPGDVIAGSTSSGWGETNYTISYLVNIDPYTAAGSYTMTENLIAVATF